MTASRTAVQAVILGLVLVAGTAIQAGEEAGIRWEPELEAGLARAGREGRPILLAVNALATERANQRLRHELYPSPAWGRATSEYVCFVGNPATHEGEAGACGTYPGIPCATHQAVLRYIVRRFDPVSGALISPQHIVLEPDGAVAFRKEYYTGVVSPRFLSGLWVGLAPELAYERAGVERADRVAAIERLDGAELDAAARAWLGEGDPLATAGLLRAIDFASDDAWALVVIHALAATPDPQLPVVDLLVDEHGMRPDDAPPATLALARALLEADRDRGVRLLARILVRTEQPTLRAQAQAAWLARPNGEGVRTPLELPPRERALLAEALLLAGVKRPPPTGPATDVAADLAPRLRRAQAHAGRRVGWPLPLPEALAGGHPGRLRASLYAATADAIRKHASVVRGLLRERPEDRVRFAAAIALMGAGLDEGGRVAPLVWSAVNDAVEGPEARREAVRRLGRDPGWNEEVWREAISQAAGGAR